jgi:LmbE family N-acetylglucosaminyl deacetylase
MHVEGKKIMIIAPHFDDEIIGCGGTICKYRDTFSKLCIVHMTSDDVRINEFEKIKKMLKCNCHYQLDAEDGFISDSKKQCVLSLIEIVQKEKPDIVFVPYSRDNHVDHIATNRIAIDAIEKARYWKTQFAAWKTPFILEYEVWSFQEEVSEVVDITECINDKLDMMRVYQSQLDFDYVNYILYCNGYRGLLFNKKGFSECFRQRRI